MEGAAKPAEFAFCRLVALYNMISCACPTIKGFQRSNVA